MPAVSNTSPLLNLAIIDRLSLLQRQFGEIYLPPAVLTELRVKESLPGSKLLQQALEAGWLMVEEVENRVLVALLRRELDKGEAEAITLALQLGASWLLLDEREGRRIARTLGLKITGILGVVMRGWREGEVSSVREVMEELRTLANFRIASALERQILQETGELEEENG